MFATLAEAPPSLTSAPPAYVDPAQDASTAAPSIMIAETAAPEPSEPIADPVPLPRTKPQARVALAAAAIPLPRPRPAETKTSPDLPSGERHGVN